MFALALDRSPCHCRRERMMLVDVGGKSLHAAPREVLSSVPYEVLSESRTLARP
jgi:hypothetical protein